MQCSTLFAPARHDVVCVLLEWLYDAWLAPKPLVQGGALALTDVLPSKLVQLAIRQG